MISLILNFLWDLLQLRRDLLLQNLALRQQILILHRQKWRQLTKVRRQHPLRHNQIIGPRISPGAISD